MVILVSDMLKRIYLPDGANLNVMLWGQAGSGKSVFIEETLKQFLREYRNEYLRVVVISPKNEGYEFGNIVYSLEDLSKSVSKERLSVFYPEMINLDETVDEAILMMFDYQGEEPKTRFVFILDDSQVFLSSRKSASDAHKRLALTGRSRKIKGIYVAHNIVFARELEGQVDLLIGFSNPNPIYYRSSIERFGFDPEPFADSLKEKPYSFVWFDTREDEPKLMNPLPYKGKP
jgi:Cdc6-like AAA superfamily ATPase